MGQICGSCFHEAVGADGICAHCGHNAAANHQAHPQALPEGSILDGRYIVGKVLGHGGFGITYLAQDFQTKGLIAIKEFFPDTMATRSGRSTVMPFTGDRSEHFFYGKDTFLHEAKTIAEFLGKESIVQVYSYFEENNTGYFTMEYVEDCCQCMDTIFQKTFSPPYERHRPAEAGRCAVGFRLQSTDAHRRHPRRMNDKAMTCVAFTHVY